MAKAFFDKVNVAVEDSIVGKYFKLGKNGRGSCFTTEMRAGLTTFLTMSYIIAVNAGILADSGGPCSAFDCVPVDPATGNPDPNGLLLGGPGPLPTDGWCIFNFYPLPESSPYFGGPNPGYAQCLSTVKLDFIVATIASTLIATFLMGITANMPVGVSAGMGINAYFTYTVVGYRGTGSVSYAAAITAVFIEGWIFFCPLRHRTASVPS